MVETRS